MGPVGYFALILCDMSNRVPNHGYKKLTFFDGTNTLFGWSENQEGWLSAFFSCPVQSLVKTPNVLIRISLTITKVMIENGAVEYEEKLDF